MSGRLFDAAEAVELGVVAKAVPDLHVVLPAAEPVAGDVRSMACAWSTQVTVLDAASDPNGTRRKAAFKAADVALAASGTVSLELAANATPMVIAYDMNWLSRQIIGRLLRVDTVTLVNLVSETRLSPEFIGAACKPNPIAKAVIDILQDPSAQTQAMRIAMDRLGKGGQPPGERAALAVLDGLK